MNRDTHAEKSRRGARIWMSALILCLLIALPMALPSSAVSLGFIALQYALFALGVNFVVGWMGLLDLGAAGFVAIGAYISAICLTQFGWPAWAVLPMVALAGLIAGILLGIPTLRHREDYFAILTLGFAELVALVIRNWPAVTKGAYGYSNIPQITVPFFSAPLHAYPPTGFYYLALGMVVPAFLCVSWIRTTALGRYFYMVKYHENVGRCYGINITGVKIIAFGLSAMLISSGGFLWSTYQRAITWSEFGVLLSCILLSLVIVGGQGNPAGAVMGAAIIGSAQELLRRLLTSYGLPQDIRFFLFAVALVCFVHFRPAGLYPDRPKWKCPDRKARKDADQAGSEKSGSEPLLQMVDVCKSFGGVRAVKNISLEIRPAECIALIGPNGSGKSTLLNLICGLLKPEAGAIHFEGRRIDRLPIHRIASLGIRRSFQDISVFDDLDVQDNIAITTPSVNTETVNRARDRFHLPSGAELCGRLSYGSKKSLDLARACVRSRDLRLMLLDEPTAGLTQVEAMAVVEALSALREETRMAMVIVSHDLMFLNALKVDQIVVMNAGGVFRRGRFASVRHDPEVIQMFWGEETTPEER